MFLKSFRPVLSGVTGSQSFSFKLLSVLFVCASGCIGVSDCSGQAVATATSLAVTSGGSAASTVAAGAVVTLTASVSAAGGSVKVGQVNFCDASAKYCTDIHVIGSAQLTSSGSATLSYRPGVGSHQYKAVFAGTGKDSGSASAVATLAVTGSASQFATVTTIAESGSFGNYALSATVTEVGGTSPVTGVVSFKDTSNSGAVLVGPSLGASVSGLAWPNPQTLSGGHASGAVAQGDFNGDGIPDIVAEAGAPGAPLNVYLGNANGSYTQTTSPAVTGYSIGPFAIADFNGDGKLDMAVLDGDVYSLQVIILLGNGDGTFTVSGANPQLTSTPTQIAAGDFNGDGIVDLVIAQSEVNGLEVLLGNGDGTFTPAATNPSAPNVTNSIVTGDFNGDGKLDLAFADQYQDDLVTVALGNGDGTFTAGTPFHVGSIGSPLVVGDFNGDGKLDLAVAVLGTNGAGDSLNVLTGNGDGTFTAPQLAATPSGAGSATGLLTGDFNADGIADIALADSGTGVVTVFTGDGKGGFSGTPLQAVPQQFSQCTLAVADVNGDGRTDLIVENDDGNTAIFTTEPTETATASGSITLDLAGMHLVDAAYAGDSNYGASTSSTTTLTGIPPGTATALSATAGGNAVTTVASGTAVTLTATVTTGGSPVTSGQVNFCDATASECTDIHLLKTSILLSGGKASYTFVPGPGTHSYKAIFVESAYGMSSTSGTAGLTVGTGKAPVYSDIETLTGSQNNGSYSLTATVVGFGGTTAPTGNVSFVDTSFSNAVLGTTALGNGTAGLGWSVLQGPALPQTLPRLEATGDFNGDGIPDLAAVSVDQYSENAEVSIYLGKGDGSFTSSGTAFTVTSSIGSISSMIAGDFNGDGKTDLALLVYNGYSESTAMTLLGNGDGSFTASAPSVIYNQGTTGGDFVPGAMVAGDFNGDGKLDLAAVGGYAGSGGMTVALGNGDGTFTGTGKLFEGATSFGAIATGDFNGDGIADLVVGSYFGPGQGIVFLGKGNGDFAEAAAQLPLSSFPRSIVAGDLNQDGVLDLAVGYSGGVQAYLGKGDGTFTAVAGALAQVSGGGLVIGDFNGDGKLDLAASDNQYGSSVSLLLGVGDGTFTVSNPVSSQPETEAIALAAADFNGDGVPDLAVLNYGSAPQLLAVLITEPTETVTASIMGQGPVGAGNHVLEANYAGDSNYPASTSNTVQFSAELAPLVATPSAGTYTTVPTVTLSEPVPGASIFYSLYGPQETLSNVPYTGPIVLNQGGTTTIEAYATETGYFSSEYLTAKYVLNFPVVPAPTFSPAPGTYAGTQQVMISDTVPGAVFHYTTDGSFPTEASPVYTGPISVSSSETLVAYASGAGYSQSTTVLGQYLISSAATSLYYRVAGNGIDGYSGDGGAAPQAQVSFYLSSAVDAAGNVYIADFENNAVRKVSAATKLISTIAGTGIAGYTGDGKAAVNAQLNGPSGVAVDLSGNVYVSEQGNEVVRRIDAQTGVITTVAGNGSYVPSGDGGPAVNAGLGYPTSVALDGLGNLYIATPGGSTVRKVNTQTGIISTYAGTGTSGYAGDGGVATAALLNSPYSVALDGAGNLYIADEGNNSIRKVTVATGIISTIAGQVTTSSYGQNLGGYSGDGGAATAAMLNRPYGVAVDGSGNVYIADSLNERIRKITAATGIITTVVGNGEEICQSPTGAGGPASSVSICNPETVATDSAGNLYVSGTYEYGLDMVTAPGSLPTTAAAAPSFSLSGGSYSTPQTLTISDTAPGAEIYVTLDGTTPTTAGTAYHEPIAIAGNVTVSAVAIAPGTLASSVTSASYTITSPPTAIIKTIAGSGQYGFSGQGGPALSADLGSIYGTAVDAAGNVYFSDLSNSVVWRVAAKTGIITVVAGTGIEGLSGDGGQATSAQLASPEGIALDSAGDLFIADSGNDLIREVAAGTGIITTVAGSSYYTNQGSLGDGGPATSAMLSSPTGVAVDGSGNFYIADESSARIRKVTASTGIITTVAGNGQLGTPTDGVAATSSSLAYPQALTLDSAGNLFILAQNGTALRRVDASTQIITTIAGDGINGQSGDGGPALAAQLNAFGIALNAAGDIFLGDYPDSVRRIDAQTGVISRFAGSGYPSLATDGVSPLMANLFVPYSVAFDSVGNLYVAEYGGKVHEITFPGPAATPTFTPAAGTYTGAQQISLMDATANATIYYTTDGSVPSTASTVYSGPITLSSNGTIEAIAVATGFTQSAVASAIYTIQQVVVPSITTLSPAFASAGGGAFTLTVNGSAFESTSVVTWGSTALPTTFVSATQLTAQVPATDVTTAGVATVTVQSPGAGGGTSNALSFEIDSAGSGSAAPTFTPASATVSAGSSATYAVTLPASATQVTVNCLNLPAGATCSYSGSSSTLTIVTASTTPKGTYPITVVFTETLPGAAAAFALPLLLLLPVRRRRGGIGRGLPMAVVIGLASALFFVVGCSSGGGGTSTPPSSQTHQVTSSGVVTLTVQ